MKLEEAEKKYWEFWAKMVLDDNVLTMPVYTLPSTQGDIDIISNIKFYHPEEEHKKVAKKILNIDK